jgi:hypothetical protein
MDNSALVPASGSQSGPAPGHATFDLPTNRTLISTHDPNPNRMPGGNFAARVETRVLKDPLKTFIVSKWVLQDMTPRPQTSSERRRHTVQRRLCPGETMPVS